MSTLQSLNTRLNALSDSYKTTLQLINRLAKLHFQPGSTPLDDSSDGDVRVELSSDIHDSLKVLEEDLELLKQEVEDLTAGDSYNYQRRRESDRERDRSRLSVQVARLAEDLRLCVLSTKFMKCVPIQLTNSLPYRARAQFRKAQLSAKRASEAAKQQERKLLLQSYQEPSRSNTPTSAGPQRRRGPEKLTEDEILVNASGDVTAALRRTQQLMSTELQRSQFAQETLDRSTQELLQLGEQYNDLDYYLKSSKTLVTSLLKSNKSDTWYLETTFYLLLVTIGWLFFRRVLYGPGWWLLYLPLRLSYKVVLGVFAAVGLTGGNSATSSTSLRILPSASDGPPRFPDGAIHRPHIQVGRGGGPPVQSRNQNQQQDPSPDESLSQEVGQMAEKAKEQVIMGDGTVLQDSDEPRNPKKRMFVPEVENAKHAQQQAEEQAERGEETEAAVNEAAVNEAAVNEEVSESHEETRQRDEL
jgi:protein transport protein SEC20